VSSGLSCSSHNICSYVAVRIVFFYTVPVQKPKQGAPEHGVDKGSSLESAEGAAYWKGGS
jgi:hypothetical protein